jgi:hypothetical protein
MKAIYVYKESISGDLHVDPVATFDEDNSQTMNQLLEELRKSAANDSSVSFEIGDYKGPVHNPKTLDEICGVNRLVDHVVSSKEVVPSYVKNMHIGNDPLW